MTKKRKILIAAAVVTAVAAVTTASYIIGFAGDSKAGTAEDPLVSVSYLDTVTGNLSTQMQTYVDEAIKKAIEDYAANDPSAASYFSPVLVPAGKTLIGGEGTELILRSGKATCVSAIVGNGLSDLTGALDLQNGSALVANHHYVVPRADGRGAYTTTDCWFMIKGTYTVQ